MPDVWHVARKPSRDNEDGVDAQVVARPQETRGEPLGGDDHAPQSPGVQRHRSRLFRGASLHFDECQNLAAAGDDVDFSAWHSGAAGKDAPAVEAQPPAGQRLGSATTFLGSFAIQRESSSARA